MTAKTTPTGNWVMRNPASAGPTARARFMLTAPSAAAARTSWRGTMSGMSACQGGMLTAAPAPSRKVKVSSSAGGMSPARDSPASTTPVTKVSSCTLMRRRRRSNESASTPAGRARSSIGSRLAVWTRRHQRGGVGIVDEQPLRADGLHPGADHAAQLGQPERPERRDAQRRPGRPGGSLGGGRAVHAWSMPGRRRTRSELPLCSARGAERRTAMVNAARRAARAGPAAPAR